MAETETRSAALQLAIDLINRASVTPADEECQAVLRARLEKIGFDCQSLPFDDVSNLWAKRGTGSPNLVFAGHTDVVPSGPLSAWHTPPFSATIKDGYLYGRGAADMKTSIAAMVVACERFVSDFPDHPGSLAFLITSDEEGVAINGTKKVVEYLVQSNQPIEACLVGEPSSSEKLGDTVKNGRRGSLSANLTVKGIQGHVAYPQLARNPIHLAAGFIHKIAAAQWDQGNAHFPPTSFQISNIKAGTGANNVIPGELHIEFNFRYSTETDQQTLMSVVEKMLREEGLDYDIQWSLSGLPFLTQPGKLTVAVSEAIKSVTGINTELSTAGGTSDGRFIATMGAQVVELGPCNATIHKVNECVRLQDIDFLTEIYYRCVKNYLLA